ncbi:hypothetical protein [Luteimonas sp. MC1828]|uniref:hypothetical protein n=1 Tax=Luteimonas sp. MC1828 TaxID=2799787 RepID=UPI0018F21064|nr:hypothetical protein [Luteimonas sp. MC1828]MBJ7575450.1 hypothetical protein [Luteimonas sp. MC1828]
MRQITLALSLALLSACTSAPQYQVTTLPNGKELKVIAITRMHSTNGINKWLILNYQTDLPIADVEALGREADEIWPYFRNGVEQAGMSVALIKASSKPIGRIIKESRAHSFAYKKAPDGIWARVGG